MLAVAAGRRRSASSGGTVTPATPPVTDDFTGTINYSKWAGSTYGVSNVAGRLQIPVDQSYSQADTGKVFDLNSYPLSIQYPTNPAVGNGTKYVRFYLTDGPNLASFYFVGTPGAVAMQLTGQSSTFFTYNATSHAWLRFRIDTGNLLWETSADKTTWTVQRTLTAPTWITGGLIAVILDAAATGTEAGSVAEFDNFNL